MRKYVCIFLCFLILISNLNVFAANVNYTPGPNTQDLVFEDVVSLTEAQLSSGALVLKKGGTAEFEYIQKFDALSVTVKYKAEEDVNLTITTDQGANVQTLFADKIEATVNLYPELRRNVQKVSLSADKDITISGIIFNKIDYFQLSQFNKIIVEYPKYMETVQSTVAISVNANAIKVNGAMRYIDYNDRYQRPLVEEGRIYLPVKTLARAFGLYFEDYPELGYVFLSNDTVEIYTTPTMSYKIVNAVKTEIDRPVIYKDGKAFMPVRLVGELLGETVGYRDGIAVIDNKVAVKNILTDDSVFEELKNELSEFNVSNATVGKTYHVSKDAFASDSNNGSEHFPFKTISSINKIINYLEKILPDNAFCSWTYET